MCFMQTELVLQTKNRSGPAKNRFSVALLTGHSACWMGMLRIITFSEKQTFMLGSI